MGVRKDRKAGERGGVGTRPLARLPHPLPIRALVCCPGMGAAEAALAGGASAAWSRPQFLVSQPPRESPAAGRRGERVVAGGAGRERAGYAHPYPQALQHAPGTHQPAHWVSPRAGALVGRLPASRPDGTPRGLLDQLGGA